LRLTKIGVIKLIKAIIFDWSGVLSDDWLATYYAAQEVLELRGLKTVSKEEFRELYDIPWPNFYKNFNIAIDMAEEHKLWEKTMPKHLHLIKPYAFAEKLLQNFRSANIKIIILSARTKAPLEKEIKSHGFEKLIDALYSAHDNKKDVIHTLLITEKLDPEEVIYIGDMPHDVETAKHAGVISVAVLEGYSTPEKLKKENPNYLIKNAEELPGLVDKINKEQNTLNTR